MWKLVKNPFDPEQLDLIEDDGEWWPCLSFIVPMCAVPAICMLSGANPFLPMNLFWMVVAGIGGWIMRSPVFGRICGLVAGVSIVLAFLWSIGILPIDLRVWWWWEPK